MPTDPYRLSLSVTHADGRISRWGPDELAAPDIPTGLTFSTSVPGGNRDCTCTLLRKLNASYSDEALFDDLRVYGPGNETAWNGRMVQFPRQHADQFSVQPGAVGHVAHLLDDPSFREIYVDRELGRWRQLNVGRRLVLATAARNYFEPSVLADSNANPVLRTQLVGPFAANSVSEAFYDSGGIPLSAIHYSWAVNGLNPATAAWVWQVATSNDDLTTTVDSSGDLQPSGGTGSGYVISTSGYRYGWLQHTWTGVADTTTGTYAVDWKLAAYGNHGLGVGHGDNPGGFYASEVIADIVARTAPLLRFTTGPGGSIEPSSFVIPHLAFTDPVTGADAITLVNGYHLFEWGVYDNREFFWRPPDPARCTWTARLADGAQISLEGDDANNIFNGVYVTYQDPSGERKTVGPPGSVADATDASLVDTDPANPVNAHGIPRRWGKLEITTTTTPAGAIQLGAVWLAEHRLPARRGQLTLTGLVEHPTRGKRPVWAVRAGDFIRIADRPGDPPRRIIEASYDHDSRRATLSLDQTVFKIEALFERLGAGLVGVL